VTSSTTFRARTRRLIRTVLSAIAALAIVATGVLFASPAFAHDELLSSDPTTDSVLDALPAQITLTFSAELLDGGGNEIVVTDASGTSLADGAAVVDGTTLVQALLPNAAPGAVSVVWRAVSSDGHPISGQYAFTVNTPAPSPTATEEETATPEPTMTATAPIGTATPEDAGSTEAANPLPWVLGAVALLLVAGVVVALLVARARRSDDVEGPGSDDTAGR